MAQKLHGWGPRVRLRVNCIVYGKEDCTLDKCNFTSYVCNPLNKTLLLVSEIVLLHCARNIEVSCIILVRLVLCVFF